MSLYRVVLASLTSTTKTRRLTNQNYGYNIVTMATRPVPRIRRRSADTADRRLTAARFKATCLQLMERVREEGVEYVVTKHGKPVAKLVPYQEPLKKPLFGSMKGTVLKYERPFDPIDGEYDIDRG